MLGTAKSDVNNAEPRRLLFPVKGERAISVSLPLKRGILAAGDLVLLNLALFLALTLRHFELPDLEKMSQHLVIFNLLHTSWIAIFYSIGLYDVQFFARAKAVERNLIQGIGIAGVLTIVLFYTLAYGTIQPRTVLAMDLAFSGIFLLAWRKAFIRYNHNGSRSRILLCGRTTEIDQLKEFLGGNGHLGYEISEPLLLLDDNNGSAETTLFDRLARDRIDMVGITRSLSEDSNTRGLFYKVLCAGLPVSDFSRLSEEFAGKIPVSAINEGWFIENLREFDKLGFEIFKRSLDIAAACLLGPIALLIAPVVALTIKLESPGPILFRQKRVGKGGHDFILLKFRTMEPDAEKEGPQWTQDGDVRVTRIGCFLRKTRIDELPQLWNVLKGEMSLVGPRPERPEFVEKLVQIIPFYEARHLVKPGLTGWAQINFRYGASIKDAMEKLQHDLYYIKKRSILLELSILLKTTGTVLRHEGR